MKRKLSYFLVGLALCGSFLYSCKKDNSTPTVTVNTATSVKNVYSLEVQVLPSSSQGAYSPISTGTVTVYVNDSAKTANIVSGIATFNNMPTGTIAGTVSVPGYAFKNFTASIDASAMGNTNSNAVASITLPQLNCSVTGIFYADYVDGYYGNNQNDALSDSTQYRPVQVTLEYTDKSIEPNVYTSLTNKNGSFALSNLPEGAVSISVIYYQQVTNTIHLYDSVTKLNDIPYSYQFVNTYSYKLDTNLTGGAQLNLGSVPLSFKYGGN